MNMELSVQCIFKFTFVEFCLKCNGMSDDRWGKYAYSTVLYKENTEFSVLQEFYCHHMIISHSTTFIRPRYYQRMMRYLNRRIINLRFWPCWHCNGAIHFQAHTCLFWCGTLYGIDLQINNSKNTVRIPMAQVTSSWI